MRFPPIVTTFGLLTLTLTQTCGASDAVTPGVGDGPAYSVQLMTGALYAKGSEPTDGRSVVMTKKGGKKYRCYLPREPNATKPASFDPNAPPPHMANYLSALIGTCFYRLEGWWTYELCISRSMRQFHQERSQPVKPTEPDAQGAGRKDALAVAQAAASLPKALGVGAITQDYTLGAYWRETVPEPQPVVDGGGSAAGGPSAQARADLRGEIAEEVPSKRRFFRQLYGNGSACDVTGRPRETEVRIFCGVGEPSHIASVEEASTCRYVVHLRSALHCTHPAFEGEIKKDATVPVKCEPLDSDGSPLPASLKTPPPAPPLAVGTPANGAQGEGAGLGSGGVAVATAARALQEAAAAAARAERMLAAAWLGAAASPREVGFEVGQCFLHRRYSYRGAILGVDAKCEQSEAWISSMHVDKLQFGRDQPFYHVLPDVRDRPGGLVAYVAQELLLLDTPAEPTQHPLASSVFDTFDAARGRFIPKQAAARQVAAIARASMAEADADDQAGAQVGVEL